MCELSLKNSVYGPYIDIKVLYRSRRPGLTNLFKQITQLTKKFIQSPVLLLGSMALFALLKVLTAPRDGS